MARLAALAATATTVVFLAGTGGYLAWHGLARGDDPLAQCRGSTTGGASIGGPFALQDATGATRTEADVLKGPTLVYFGYTFCPDVCPLDMSRNAEVLDIVEEQGHDLGLVFITIDPERDTPQVAGEFATTHHPRAIGLSGTPEQISVATKAYRAYAARRDGEDPEFYLMDHSAFTYLMLPGTGLADFYRPDMSADQMAQSVGCFLDATAG